MTESGSKPRLLREPRGAAARGMRRGLFWRDRAAGHRIMPKPRPCSRLRLWKETKGPRWRWSAPVLPASRPFRWSERQICLSHARAARLRSRQMSFMPSPQKRAPLKEPP